MYLYGLGLLRPRYGCKLLRWVFSVLCLSVCLSIRSHISKTTRPDFTKFSVYILTVTVSRGLPFTTLEYVMHFRFCGWCHICPLCANVTSSTTPEVHNVTNMAYTQSNSPGAELRAKCDVYDCLAIFFRLLVSFLLNCLFNVFFKGHGKWPASLAGPSAVAFDLLLVMVALCNRADHYIFILFLISSSFLFYFLT